MQLTLGAARRRSGQLEDDTQLRLCQLTPEAHLKKRVHVLRPQYEFHQQSWDIWSGPDFKGVFEGSSWV